MLATINNDMTYGLQVGKTYLSKSQNDTILFHLPQLPQFGLCKTRTKYNE